MNKDKRKLSSSNMLILLLKAVCRTANKAKDTDKNAINLTYIKSHFLVNKKTIATIT